MNPNERDETDWPTFSMGVNPVQQPTQPNPPPQQVEVPGTAIDAEIEFRDRQLQIILAAIAGGVVAGLLGLTSWSPLPAWATAGIGAVVGGLSMMAIHRIKDAFKK